MKQNIVFATLTLCMSYTSVSSYTLLRAENGSLSEWNSNNNNNNNNNNDDEEFVFVQITDTQFGLIRDSWAQSRTNKTRIPKNGYDKNTKLFFDSQLWTRMVETIHGDQETLRLKKILEKINTMATRPEFVVFTGDMVDAKPKRRLLPKRANQELAFREALTVLNQDIPMIVLPGNHDVADAPSEKTLKLYRDSFGEDYFSFWVKGSFFIVLDSQFYMNTVNAEKESQKQDEWLDQQLTEIRTSKPRHSIVLLHVPPFLYSYEEPKIARDNWDPVVRRRILTKLHEAGVTKIYAGHHHGNAGGFAFNGTLEVVITTAVSLQYWSDVPGATIVRVGPRGVEHQFYPIEKFPGTN